jgi:hypothetical protein
MKSKYGPLGELGYGSEYGDSCPDRGCPKAARQEHDHNQRAQPDQPPMDSGFPNWSHPRPIISALQQNSAVHRLLPS